MFIITVNDFEYKRYRFTVSVYDSAFNTRDIIGNVTIDATKTFYTLLNKEYRNSFFKLTGKIIAAINSELFFTDFFRNGEFSPLMIEFEGIPIFV